jgi:RNA polymerase sporulation-specific sigma factor
MDYSKMTDEELVQAYRNRNADAIDVLMGKYKLLVRGICRARFLTGGEEEDLIQEGMIGLYKAVRDYDASKDASFRTFANLCIQRQVLKAIESSQREKNRPLNDSVALTDEEWDEQIHSEKISPESILLDREAETETRKKIFNTLSPMEQTVLKLYLKGMNYRSIAKEMHKSPKTIDNALQRIRRKVRQTIHS